MPKRLSGEERARNTDGRRERGREERGEKSQTGERKEKEEEEEEEESTHRVYLWISDILLIKPQLHIHHVLNYTLFLFFQIVCLFGSIGNE